jgi:hypothetical protein
VIAVPVAVNPYLMPTGNDLTQLARVALYLFSGDKESSPRPSLFHKGEEGVESLIRPVVKG